MEAPVLSERPTDGDHRCDGVMARLLVETHDLQRGVECELDLLGARTSWLDYRLYLFRMYGFHVPIERALDATPQLASVVPDAALRNNKVALLAHDLVALGVARRDLAQLPRMPVPALALGEALGWMYVLEATTLRSKALCAHLSKVLPHEISTASAYLGCYGHDVEKRWSELGTRLESFSATDVADQIATGAVDCLTRLHRWLKPANLRQPRVHA
ncbi:MAG: biliverdin-producing heme oxygenase [Kofleriaceae bacterium]